MGSGGTRVKTGQIVGTGAAINVRSVGFRPDVVELINTTSHDKLKWASPLADAYGHKTVAAGTSTLITSGGITPLSDGFKLGTDADMNVDGEVVLWIAHE
jgi:hypothetical protein